MKALALNIRQIWAVAKKELQLESRYLLPLLTSVFFNPLKTAIWFVVVYYGFFAAGASGVGDFNEGNYIQFIIIGSLFHTFFTIATGDFPSKFMEEKYWRTIQSILIAPINSFKFVIGLGLSELIKTSFAVIILLGIVLVISPVSILKIGVILLILLLCFWMLMFLGLIRAGYVLVNENINTVFNYIFLGIGFISCFYYPISSFPEFLRPIIYINPIYQALSFVRSYWEGTPIDLVGLGLFLVAVVIITFISVIWFRKTLEKNDVQGY